MLETSPPEIFDCQSCGACCAYQADWPRFSLESDEQLAAIPEALVADDLSGMKFLTDAAGKIRCAALTGVVGQHVGCSVYTVRPQVCRDCMPGDPECHMARQALGFAVDTLPEPDVFWE
ncbi:YkgJ family cysteine cluster protein [Allorhizobium sp. BGMRC 0089]|uniref:YkgJ family cysteine cluster protein n=1 Tax=Allorhizobium sonneratiae TaxID=2934936 RepID=UPI002034371B|nr:YkgJ family cysteine cluster protein [Allorhizobium sonneratiae]MCM2291855.1 YkgJ family cysteine cluster protein [Allorhizobium sonneratiae]